MQVLIYLLLYVPPVAGTYFVYRGLKKRQDKDPGARPDRGGMPLRLALYTGVTLAVLNIAWSLFLYGMAYLFQL